MIELKKILKSASLFLAIVVCLYSLLVFVLLKVKVGKLPLFYRTSDVINWKGGNTYRKFTDFQDNQKYDVIVIGSSHAYRGYDPRIFKAGKVNMFNLGTSGQSLLNSYFIATNYIKSSNCGFVILDVYDGALASDGLESAADLIQNISSDKAALEMGAVLKDPRAINMLTVRVMNASAAPMYVDSNYVVNGYSEKRDSVREIDKSLYNPQFKVNPVQLNYLGKLLDYFKVQGIKAVVVSHPAPAISNNGNHLVFSKCVDSITTMHGVEYLDYTYRLNFPAGSYFYDTHHLNQRGVEKFDSVLLHDLTQKKYLNWQN